MVWSNPRYLIGGGDNPTILHEGCRLVLIERSLLLSCACVMFEIIKWREYSRCIESYKLLESFGRESSDLIGP